LEEPQKLNDTGARIEALRGVGIGERVSPSPSVYRGFGERREPTHFGMGPYI